MYNLISFELFKLRKDRAFRTLLLMVAAIALVYPLISYFSNKASGYPLVPGVAILFDSLAINSFLIKFEAAILAGFFIASEYSTGVMKTMASSGNSRGKLFIAKLIGFGVGAMALAVIFPTVSTIEGTFLAGFGHPQVDATSVFGQLPNDVSAAFIMRTLGLTLLFSASFATIAAFFSALLTDSGKTIGFTIVFFLMIDTILSGLGVAMPFFDKIHEHSVFKLLGEVGRPVMEANVLAIVLVPLLTIGVAGLLGILVFRRKEIK